jgi:hypothetical protein
MNETKPNMGPGGFQGPASGASTAGSMPSATPPAGVLRIAIKGDCGCGSKAGGGYASAGAPTRAMTGVGDTAPSIRPAEAVNAGVSGWQSNKKITGLWSINENRNSWVYIDTIGWKRLANNSDSAIAVLTTLSAHAREKGSVVNYREESDGQILEMYVW